MADSYQQHSYRTFEHYGYFVDHVPDAQRITWGKDGKPRPLAHNSGRADNIIMGDGFGCAVEVKTASGVDYRRFQFDGPSGWKEEQRKWSEKWIAKGNTYWLMIFFGNHANSKDWRLKCYLIERSDWLLVEAYKEALNKKSVNYTEMEELRPECELRWAGKSRWEIPLEHRFWSYVPCPSLKEEQHERTTSL